MNSQQFTPAYIAQYSDMLFRTGLKGKDDDEIETKLDALIRLFCCLHGRDVFLKQYEKELSGRLLNKTSIDWSIEEKMIQKLKVECGANQVQKMTQMFKDMTLSKEVQQEFNTHLSSTDSKVNGVEFVPEVLTNGTWPPMDKKECKLPPELSACCTRFETFFKNKNQNRTLSWMYNFGSVEIVMTKAKKRYQLIVNVF